MSIAPLELAAPRLYRNTSGRLLGGVAGAVADYLGLSRRLVRLAFIVLSFCAGLGVLLYGAFWIVLPLAEDAPAPGSARSAVEYLLALITGAVVVLLNVRALPIGWWLVPSLLACFGGALLWRQASETDRDRWRRLSRSSLSAGAADRAGWLRIVAGVVLVVAGAGFTLARVGFSAVGAGLAAVVVTVAGLSLVTGPWWLRLVRELSDERRERIRSEERADIAANLHDSVLQTLALIQRNADRPREVSRLARRQERELRSKLYGAGVPSGEFGAALHQVAAEIEDDFAVAVDVVVVGEQDLTPALDALVAATREALVNAGKHAGVDSVSLYAEVDGQSASVFVRDRGVGFDPDRIEQTRQGIRGSIVSRLSRVHGTARVTSQPGAGTEVELRVEVR